MKRGLGISTRTCTMDGNGGAVDIKKEMGSMWERNLTKKLFKKPQSIEQQLEPAQCESESGTEVAK